MSDTHEPKTLTLHRNQWPALLVGIVAIIAVLIGMFSGSQAAWQAYLFAFVVWASLTLGSFGVLLLFHTVNGSWGLPILRLLEAASSRRNFILLAVLFLPLLYSVLKGDATLYPWASASVVANDHALQMKQAYLNPTGFAIRAVLFFLLWMGLSAFLRKSTLRQDQTRDAKETARRSSWAAPGIVAFVLSLTFAFTDWIMSLEPHWSSTIYAFWWIAGMSLMAFAFTTIVATLNKDREPYAGLVTPSWTRDMGNLMLTFTMLWGYTSLSQYLIIWSGNLPETISFYVQRSNNHWNAIGMACVVGQFFVPFLCLLSPRIKAQSQLLSKLCGWILAIRLLDMYYVVMPAMRETPMPMVWDIVALIGVGGLWSWAFLESTRKAPLMPQYDPRLWEEAHAH